MRYAAPVAMPAGLGEWLGAELEARGVEAASLYARAVLSILLHSENDVDLMERELEQQQHFGIHPRAALELELRLERHNKEKETRKGRACKKSTAAAASANASVVKSGANSGHLKSGQRSSNMPTSHRIRSSAQTEVTRRRPHSWNGDEEELKKCAAIECLLSATDDDQWPVEKLVDELCARLKLLQLEQQNDARGSGRRLTGLGSSAPECFDGPSSDSDSFTSVSSPEIEPENYYQAFPPLEYLSDCEEQKVEPVPESIWDVRSKVKSPAKSSSSSYSHTNTKSRVPFVRMTGARLSPAPYYDLHPQHLEEHIQLQSSKLASNAPCSASVPVPQLASSCGDTSEAYFGDCSRDSSVERAPTPPLAPKGRLYERGPVHGWALESSSLFGSSSAVHGQRLSHELDKALKSLARIHEETDIRKSSIRLDPAEINGLIGGGRRRAAELEEWSLQSSLSNIWAPLESDWALIRSDPDGWPTPVAGAPLFPVEESSSVADKVSSAVQLSLALLNHHPEISSFTPVLPLKSSSDIWSTPGGSGTSSKLMEWLVGLDPVVPPEEADGEGDEVESIMKEEAGVIAAAETEGCLPDPEDKEEEENLLTSPKTHFCPIQLQEGDTEVKVKDGATFQVDAQPEEVHFLRSPSGALYLPECEDNGDGWKGWAKYMVYKTPTSPSPTLLETNEPADATTSPRPVSPFTLKFRVVQTEKCCQTDLALVETIGHSNDVENGAADETTTPLAISSPFLGPYSSGIGTRLLDPEAEVWKFDARTVSLKDLRQIDAEVTAAEDGEATVGDADVDEELDVKEEVDGLLKEVWNVTVVQDASTVAAEDESKETAVDGPEIQVDEEEKSDNDWFTRYQHQQSADEGESAKKEFEYLDELWNPLMSDGGEDQGDVCEWIPQPYDEDGMVGEDDGVSAPWALGEVGADSWPPPNIPVEYLDDEFFDEIFGSLDSKASEPAGGGGGGGGGVGGGSKNSRRHCRRRRRNSQKVPPAQRRRPCSFFVEGECRRPDCKFSHDLGSIPCRFWIESSCFKGDACPFLHGLPVKEVRDSHQKNYHGHRHYPSDVELSEGCASATEEGADLAPPHRFHQRKGGAAATAAAGKKKFQFDLEADFPCLSADSIKPAAASAPVATVVAPRGAASHSRPIPIAGVGFAAADNTGSSLENGGANDCTGGAAAGGVKRRRRKFPSQRVAAAVNVVGTSSESSPGEMTVSAVNHHHNPPAAGKRSRKVAKVITVGFQQPANTSATTSSSSGNKKEKGKGSCQPAADGGQPLERRRTKSEHDAAPSAPVISTAGSNSGNSSSAGSGGRADGISRLRLSSSYKEG